MATFGTPNKCTKTSIKTGTFADRHGTFAAFGLATFFSEASVSLDRGDVLSVFVAPRFAASAARARVPKSGESIVTVVKNDNLTKESVGGERCGCIVFYGK